MGMGRFLKRVKKAIGTLLGGVTAGAVVVVLKAAGVDVSMEVAGAIALLATTAGTWLAPKNAE